MAVTLGDQVWDLHHGSPRQRARLESLHQGKGFLGVGRATAAHLGHLAQSPPAPGCWRPLPHEPGPLANVGVVSSSEPKALFGKGASGWGV